MNRDVPFDELAVCDSCGETGAFDFIGDFYCADCLAKMFSVIDDDNVMIGYIGDDEE